MFSRTAAFTAMLLLAVGATLAIAFSDGPPAGRTGAPAIGGKPAEGLCTVCHTTFAANLPGATLTLSSVPDTYVPDGVYTIRVTLASTFTPPRRWGFQLTAIAAASGDSAGSFAPFDNTTQVIDGGTTYPTRQYIEHSTNGTFPGTLGPQTWAVRWKAPSSNVGRVLFFAAGNAANNNNFNNGDHIYTARDTSEYDVTVGVPAAPLAGLALSAGPNPSRGAVAVNFTLPRAGHVDLGVYDTGGRRVATLAQGAMAAGRHDASWNGRVAPGVYWARLTLDGNLITRKVVVAH